MMIFWLLGVLLLPISVSAAVFWTEDFENHLYPNWVGGGDCITAGSPDGAACVWPQITTAESHGGTHSLLSHYDDQLVQTGTHIDRAHTGTDDIYMRWWQKYSPGSTIGTNEHKNFINESTPAWFYWKHNNDDALGGGGWAVKQSYTCPNGFTVAAGDTCNVPPNITSISLLDGQWHCIETHAGLGTIGGRDGSLDIWVDGTHTTTLNDIPVRDSSEQFNIVAHYAQYGAVGDRYIDDLAVGNTRFNDCAGGGGGGGSTAGGGLDF